MRGTRFLSRLRSFSIAVEYEERIVSTRANASSGNATFFRPSPVSLRPASRYVRLLKLGPKSRPAGARTRLGVTADMRYKERGVSAYG